MLGHWCGVVIPTIYIPNMNYKRYKRLGDIKSDFLQKTRVTEATTNGVLSHHKIIQTQQLSVTNKKLDWDNKTETEIRTREKKQRYRTHTQKDIDVSHTNVEDFLKKQHTINTSTHYIAYVVGLVYGKILQETSIFNGKGPWFPLVSNVPLNQSNFSIHVFSMYRLSMFPYMEKIIKHH